MTTPAAAPAFAGVPCGINNQLQASAKQHGAGVTVITSLSETGPEILIVGAARKFGLSAWTVILMDAALLFCDPLLALKVNASGPTYPAAGV